MPKVIYHAKDKTVRRPATWRVTRHPELSRDYEFVDGEETEVAPEDLAVLLDPKRVGGRSFERVQEKREARTGGQAAPTNTGSAGGGGSSTPPASKPDDPKTDAGGGGAGKPEK